MKLYSSGDVADLFGVHRDKVLRELKSGAPQASVRIGTKRGFTEDDIMKLHEWFVAKGITVTEPVFPVEAEQ